MTGLQLNTIGKYGLAGYSMQCGHAMAWPYDIVNEGLL
jgi:hypothetical protein